MPILSFSTYNMLYQIKTVIIMKSDVSDSERTSWHYAQNGACHGDQSIAYVIAYKMAEEHLKCVKTE